MPSDGFNQANLCRDVANLLPTPTARDGKDGQIRREPHRPDDVDTLARALTVLLPTPSAADGLGGHERRGGARGDELLLNGVAKEMAARVLLPTPTSQAAKHAGGDTDRGPGTPDDANLWIIAQRGQWGDYAPAIHRWEQILGRPAPAPTVISEGWKKARERRLSGNHPARIGFRGSVRQFITPTHQLSPRFVEWMQGLPEGWVDDVPNLTRNEKLKALGNGVVSQQAVEAVLRLLALGERVAA